MHKLQEVHYILQKAMGFSGSITGVRPRHLYAWMMEAQALRVMSGAWCAPGGLL